MAKEAERISGRISQFRYFNKQLGRPDWTGKNVLDFGGNIGGFLSGAHAQRKIDPRLYWCLDVYRPALAQGRRTHPHAHFVHFDRYNSEYNPTGIPGLPIPDLGTQFDFILAFSVFTHIDASEMLELVAQLQTRLAPDGVLAFTFCDQSYPALPPNKGLRRLLIEHRKIEPNLDVERLLAEAAAARWFIWADGVLHCEPGGSISQLARRGQPFESYDAFYTPEVMQSLFPQARILPPVLHEWQHCCVLGPDGAPS
ncbi:MAG TPA: class I SAM-dependent methyltransferase [Thermoanaerobaculia bacterium]|nr:class I SAM-dependent methyltransferase [Thermoanaerobaculia bacterium]